MSLISALNVGQSGLAVSQAMLQVTGNNISNSGDPNYTREVATSTPGNDEQLGNGIFIGTGTDLSAIQRQVDDSLNQRLNSSVSDNAAANITEQWSGQIESVFNALGSNSLDTQMTNFLNDWSNLANNPTDAAQRAVVVNDGQSLSQQFNSLSGQLQQMQSQAGTQLSTLTTNASQIASQIASLNSQISQTQGSGVGSDNSLLDQRDAAINQLSSLVNVQTVDQGNGMVNVYIGSQPLVLGSTSRGLTTTQTVSATGQPTYQLQFADNNGPVSATSGQLSATIAAQQQVGSVLGQLNSVAAGFISGLNSLHASGQGLNGYSSVTATNQVLDPTAALNSAAAGLSTAPVNGSFVVTVTNSSTGLSSSTLVPVNLSGVGPQTTLNSLAASLNGITNVQASIVGGQLTISSTNPSDQITFSQDSSNTLASLGINTFFQGTNAQNMAVNSAIVASPNLIAAAQNGQSGDNSNALAIANMANVTQPTLGGQSVMTAYQSMIDGVAETSATAQNAASSTLDITNALQAQQQAVSGVSVDEETINMIKQQLAYQGSARLVSTIDTLMATLMAIT